MPPPSINQNVLRALCFLSLLFLSTTTSTNCDYSVSNSTTSNASGISIYSFSDLAKTIQNTNSDTSITLCVLPGVYDDVSLGSFPSNPKIITITRSNTNGAVLFLGNQNLVTSFIFEGIDFNGNGAGTLLTISSFNLTIKNSILRGSGSGDNLLYMSCSEALLEDVIMLGGTLQSGCGNPVTLVMRRVWVGSVIDYMATRLLYIVSSVFLQIENCIFEANCSSSSCETSMIQTSNINTTMSGTILYITNSTNNSPQYFFYSTQYPLYFTSSVIDCGSMEALNPIGGPPPSINMVNSMVITKNLSYQKIFNTTSNLVGGGPVSNVFSLFPGLCKRYDNGVLTDVPLWPWSMDQRLFDVMVEINGKGFFVTDMIQMRYGQIPPQCYVAPAPAPMVLNPFVAPAPAMVLNPPARMMMSPYVSPAPMMMSPYVSPAPMVLSPSIEPAPAPMVMGDQVPVSSPVIIFTGQVGSIHENSSIIIINETLHVVGDLTITSSSIKITSGTSTTVGGQFIVSNSTLNFGVGTSIFIQGNTTITNSFVNITTSTSIYSECANFTNSTLNIILDETLQDHINITLVHTNLSNCITQFKGVHTNLGDSCTNYAVSQVVREFSLSLTFNADNLACEKNNIPFTIGEIVGVVSAVFILTVIILVVSIRVRFARKIVFPFSSKDALVPVTPIKKWTDQ